VHVLLVDHGQEWNLFHTKPSKDLILTLHTDKASVAHRGESPILLNMMTANCMELRFTKGTAKQPKQGQGR